MKLASFLWLLPQQPVLGGESWRKTERKLRIGGSAIWRTYGGNGKKGRKKLTHAFNVFPSVFPFSLSVHLWEKSSNPNERKSEGLSLAMEKGGESSWERERGNLHNKEKEMKRTRSFLFCLLLKKGRRNRREETVFFPSHHFSPLDFLLPFLQNDETFSLLVFIVFSPLFYYYSFPALQTLSLSNFPSLESQSGEVDLRNVTPVVNLIMGNVYPWRLS